METHARKTKYFLPVLIVSRSVSLNVGGTNPTHNWNFLAARGAYGGIFALVIELIRKYDLKYFHGVC